MAQKILGYSILVLLAVFIFWIVVEGFNERSEKKNQENEQKIENICGTKKESEYEKCRDKVIEEFFAPTDNSDKPGYYN